MSFTDNSGNNGKQPVVSTPGPQVFDYPVTESKNSISEVHFSSDTGPSSDSSTIRPLTNDSGPLGAAEMFNQNQGVIFDNSANVESNRLYIDNTYYDTTKVEAVGSDGPHSEMDTLNHNQNGGLPKGVKI